MKYSFDGFNWIVRLEKGEKLVASLTQLIKEESIKGAWVTGLGGALQAELGFYQLDKQKYDFKVVDQLLEITSIQGNVSWLNNEPKLHLHGSFSDENMQAIGGHIKELTVGGTCEIMIHVFQKPLIREHNDEVGLPLLNL